MNFIEIKFDRVLIVFLLVIFFSCDTNDNGNADKKQTTNIKKERIQVKKSGKKGLTKYAIELQKELELEESIIKKVVAIESIYTKKIQYIRKSSLDKKVKRIAVNKAKMNKEIVELIGEENLTKKMKFDENWNAKGQ